MTYNVFGGTLSLTQSINLARAYICLTVCAGYDISKIGSVFEAPNSVGFGNTAFLITVPAADKPGVLFAYRAYIANANAMLVLQLWRPVRSSGRSRHFRLVDDLYFSPSRLGQEDVSHAVVHCMLLN